MRRRTGRPKELRAGGGHFTFYVSPALVEEFENTLPRNKSISEALREHMESVILEKNREGSQSIDLSAIRQGVLSDTITPEAVNQSLDRYMRHCCETENIEELGAYEAGAYGYHQFIKKRILYIKRK